METPNFDPFPTLEGKQIILREITVDDVLQILELRSNLEAMKYVPRPLMQTVQEAYDFIEVLDNKKIKGEGINWAICLKPAPDAYKPEKTLIGNICHFNFNLEANRSEVGYMLHPDYFRKGIMTEALQLVLDYGFNTLNLNSTEAIIIEDNIASRKVAEKAGFSLDGITKESCYHNNRYYNQCFYGMLKKEFQKEKP